MSPIYGTTRVFSTPGDLELVVHFPPYHPDPAMAECAPRPFLERVDKAADNVEMITEHDIATNGMR